MEEKILNVASMLFAIPFILVIMMIVAGGTYAIATMVNDLINDLLDSIFGK